MKSSIIEWFLQLLNPKLIGEIVVEILWELAKSSENTLDDRIIKALAEALNIELDD